jgi:hypothetical protein
MMRCGMSPTSYPKVTYREADHDSDVEAFGDALKDRVGAESKVVECYAVPSGPQEREETNVSLETCRVVDLL